MHVSMWMWMWMWMWMYVDVGRLCTGRCLWLPRLPRGQVQSHQWDSQLSVVRRWPVQRRERHQLHAVPSVVDQSRWVHVRIRVCPVYRWSRVGQLDVQPLSTRCVVFIVT